MPTEDVFFDPNIYLPDDLGGAAYIDTDRSVRDIVQDSPELLEDGEEFVDEIDIDFDDDGVGDEPEADVDIDTLDVPQFFSVVDTITRTSPDGTQVVDIVLDIQEVPRAVNYEVRLA